ncbi:MAG: hypothetical protein IKI48_06635, partial [Prevotella sp.]|nr:hypothetical protein [Prevotella sp.]
VVNLGSTISSFITFWFSLFYNESIITVILTGQKYNLSRCASFTKSITIFTNCRKNTPRFGKILYFRAMKVDFLYSTDFLAMNAPELGHTCCVEVIIT